MTTQTISAVHERQLNRPIEDRIRRVRDAAYQMRLNVLDEGEAQGEGYVGQALGIADVLAVLYADQMRYQPADSEWEDRDRFLLSIGHYALAIYAALAEAGGSRGRNWRPTPRTTPGCPCRRCAPTPPGGRSRAARSVTDWGWASATRSGCATRA